MSVLSEDEFYGRIYSLTTKLKEIGISDKNRWIFNHGVPTSMRFLCNRINWELHEISEIMIFEQSKNKGCLRENIMITDAPGPGFALYRWLQLDIFQLFILLRSFLDELCKFVLKPKLSISGRELENSFADLFKKLEDSHKKIYEVHREYFTNIEEKYNKLIKDVRDPRDDIIHHSSQIEFKYEKDIWYYALVNEGDILKEPRIHRNWKKMVELNQLTNITADIFEESINYIYSLYLQKTPCPQLNNSN